MNAIEYLNNAYIDHSLKILNTRKVSRIFLLECSYQFLRVKIIYPLLSYVSHQRWLRILFSFDKSSIELSWKFTEWMTECDHYITLLFENINQNRNWSNNMMVLVGGQGLILDANDKWPCESSLTLNWNFDGGKILDKFTFSLSYSFFIKILPQTQDPHTTAHLASFILNSFMN